jgi:nicotinate phosphoribosyltransferase
MIDYRPMPSALSIDLYEITMAAGYYSFGEIGQGSFELSVRHLPPDRGYLIAAGLDQALEYLERLHFEPD